ncbi:MAG: TonB family protein [Bacteroidales bacterium]|nr:TonB family protein [Bacteroidales bacterium]
MKKLLLIFFLLAIVATGIQAQTFVQKCSTGQELRYQIQADQKTVALVEIVMEDYPDDDYPGDLVIPEKVTYKGRSYLVTTIGKRTFVGNYGVLQTVTIPKSITFIDESAFGDGGETGIYDVKVAKDNPIYQVEAENNEDSTMSSVTWTTRLIDKRTQKVLWFTVEELVFSNDPEEIIVEPEMKEYFMDEIVEVEEEEPVTRIPASLAEFPGGMAALQEYLVTNCQYPQEAIEQGQQGVVMIEFVVEKDGTISNITVQRGVCEALDEEAIRVVKAMPRWKPADDNGRKCRSYYTIPVIFLLK